MKMASLFAFTYLALFKITVAWANDNSTLRILEEKLMTSNPQVRALEATVNSQKATAYSQIGNFLPKISVTGGYGENKTIQEPSEGYLGYVSGTWNLYRGGEDSSLKTISSKELEISKLNLDIKSRSLRRQLREIYYALLANKKNLILLDEKSDFLQKQRQMAQKKINAGLTSSVDAIEIDLEENNILSEREVINNEIERFTRDLAALIDSDATTISVSSDEQFIKTGTEVAIDKALNNNPSLKRQSSIEEIAHATVEKQRSEFLPTLDVEASYGRITPEYSDPLKGTESKFAILLSWNIFSGMSSYYRKQAASFTATTEGFNRNNTYLEIKKDLQNLLTTRSNLTNLKGFQNQRLNFAQKYYEMTLSEYKRGIKNSPDLQSATAALFEAKRKMLELERDFSITDAKINELI